MRLLAASVLLLVSVAVLVPTGTAAPVELSDVTFAANPVVQETRPLCSALLDELRDAGVVGDHDHSEPTHEDEWLQNAPECRELRDEVEHSANVYGAIGYQEECTYVYGVTCVAVNHPLCDFGIMVATGVYYCVGGLNPEN